LKLCDERESAIHCCLWQIVTLSKKYVRDFGAHDFEGARYNAGAIYWLATIILDLMADVKVDKVSAVDGALLLIECSEKVRVDYEEFMRLLNEEPFHPLVNKLVTPARYIGYQVECKSNNLYGRLYRKRYKVAVRNAFLVYSVSVLLMELTEEWTSHIEFKQKPCRLFLV